MLPYYLFYLFYFTYLSFLITDVTIDRFYDLGNHTKSVNKYLDQQKQPNEKLCPWIFAALVNF